MRKTYKAWAILIDGGDFLTKGGNAPELFETREDARGIECWSHGIDEAVEVRVTVTLQRKTRKASTMKREAK